MQFSVGADAARLGTAFGGPLAKRDAPGRKLGGALASWCHYNWKMTLGPTLPCWFVGPTISFIGDPRQDSEMLLTAILNHDNGHFYSSYNVLGIIISI